MATVLYHGLQNKQHSCRTCEIDNFHSKKHQQHRMVRHGWMCAIIAYTLPYTELRVLVDAFATSRHLYCFVTRLKEWHIVKKRSNHHVQITSSFFGLCWKRDRKNCIFPLQSTSTAGCTTFVMYIFALSTGDLHNIQDGSNGNRAGYHVHHFFFL